jgi:hypothetical protein
LALTPFFHPHRDTKEQSEPSPSSLKVVMIQG